MLTFLFTVYPGLTEAPFRATVNRMKLQSQTVDSHLFTSISCSCSWLVEYICCSPCSSSLFRSRRVFPSSAASCRSAGETGRGTTSASEPIVQSHWWTHEDFTSSFVFSFFGRSPVTHFYPSYELNIQDLLVISYIPDSEKYWAPYHLPLFHLIFKKNPTNSRNYTIGLKI